MGPRGHDREGRGLSVRRHSQQNRRKDCEDRDQERYHEPAHLTNAGAAEPHMDGVCAYSKLERCRLALRTLITVTHLMLSAMRTVLSNNEVGTSACASFNAPDPWPAV